MKKGKDLLREALGFDPPPHRLPYEDFKTDYGIGIVGLHWVVQIMHLPAYVSAGYRLAAGCDNDEERIREAEMKRWPFKTMVRDYREMIRLPEVEVIDSSFGHNPKKQEKRRELVEAAAAAGKPLMIHKPAASTLGLAEEMADIAEQAGIPLTVNQDARYNPSAYAIKQLLMPERMGPPELIEIQNYWQGPPPKKGEGSSQWIAHVVHHADLVRWWMDRPCVSVYARAAGNATMAVYEFDDGTPAYHMEASTGVRAHETYIRIQTERGVIKAGFNWNWHLPSAREYDFVEVYPDPNEPGIRLPLPEHIYEPVWSDINKWMPKTGPYYDLAAPIAGMMGSMGSLLRGVAENKTPDNGIRGAIESLRMSLATEVSAARGQPVDPRDLPPETTSIRP